MRKNGKNKTEMISDIYMYFELSFIMRSCLLILTSGKKDKILLSLEGELAFLTCVVLMVCAGYLKEWCQFKIKFNHLGILLKEYVLLSMETGCLHYYF